MTSIEATQKYFKDLQNTIDNNIQASINFDHYLKLRGAKYILIRSLFHLRSCYFKLGSYDIDISINHAIYIFNKSKDLIDLELSNIINTI